MLTIDEVRNITQQDITAIVGSFLATVAPGVLILNFYRPELVSELESVKLILLSAALTLPVLVVNALIMLIAGIAMGFWSKGKIKGRHLFFYHALWAFMVLYGTLLLAYLCNFNIEQFLLAAAVIDIIVGFAVIALTAFLSNASA